VDLVVIVVKLFLQLLNQVQLTLVGLLEQELFGLVLNHFAHKLTHITHLSGGDHLSEHSDIEPDH
jgi:hypothetical protein